MIHIVVSGLCANEICRLASELGRERVAVRETIDIAGATEVAQVGQTIISAPVPPERVAHWQWRSLSWV